MEPFKSQMYLLQAVRTGKLPREFIPGIQGTIPLSPFVESDAPMVYETPRMIRDR